jgi:hypothetical protein
MEILRPGDLMPHFEVTDLTGRLFVYRDAAWQRRNLVLVCVPPQTSEAEAAGYLAGLTARADEFDGAAAVTIVTRDPTDGLPAGVVVADRWGEIFHVEHVADAALLPTADALVEWAEFVQRQCPECQAEAR